MEAEGASYLWLEANNTVLQDGGASGGKCVAFVERLNFVIDVFEEGDYQSWTRCFFPFAASWNHSEHFDEGRAHTVQDLRPEDREKAGKWIWLKGPLYHLKPGVRTYTFDGYHGGARLDKLLLTKDLSYVPTGMGGDPVNIAAHRTGWAETRDMTLGKVSEWIKLVGLSPVGVRAKVSLDGGQTWYPLPADGSLESLPLSPDLRTKARVRVELTRTEAVDPIVENLRLVYRQAEEQTLSLANQHLRIAFDSLSGSLIKMERLAEGKVIPCLIPGEQQPLFTLYLQEPDREDTLIPITSLEGEIADTRLSDGGRGLSLVFSLAEGKLRVQADVTLEDSPLTRWKLSVTNHSEAKVFAVQFPYLPNLRIGESPEDDVMVLPWWGAGSRTVNPAGAEWTPFRKLLGYPGAASMQWLDLADPSGGIYVAAYDPTCRDMEIGYTQNRGESVNVTLKKWLLIPPGKDWSCEYAVGIHPGDWHWAADRYREWAATWQQSPPLPAWVKDVDGWILPDGANFMGYPNLPLYYRLKHKLFGMNWMQCWMQMTEGEHCCGQFHYPCPLWGTPEDFRWGCQAIHDAGGRVGFYINAQLFKPWHNNQATNIGGVPIEFIPKEVMAPYDPDWAFRWQAKDFAGRPYDLPSSNPHDDGVRMNPASSGWQNHLIHWAADWYVEKFGTDCIYFDQLSAAHSLPVYNDSRTDFGLWGEGYRQMLTRLLQKVLPKHPNFVLSMEGTSDLHGQLVGTALYGTGPDYFDVFHYTFPQHILIDYGAYINAWNKEFPGQRPNFLNTFLMGTRFCEYPPDDWGRALFALRRRLQSLTFRASYRDTVGLSVADSTVRAKRFILHDENARIVMVNIGNLEKKPGVSLTVELSPLQDVRSAYIFGMDGSVTPLEYTAHDGKATFEVPPFDASTAVFVEHIAPLLEKVEFPLSTTSGTRVKGSVSVRNLSSSPMQGTVSLIAPRGWKCDTAMFTGLAAGQSKTVELHLEVPHNAARRIHDLFVLVRGTGGQDRRFLGIAVAPPVEFSEALIEDDGVTATVRNRSPRKVTASLSLDAFRGVKAPTPRSIALHPGQAVRVRFDMVWPDLSMARIPQTVRIAAEAEGMKTVRSLVVGPPVINGSFDMAVINRDKPEGWTIFGNRPDCVHVVSEHPFDGASCLRVDPAPTAPNVDQVIYLRPNTTYRLSAALRRLKASDNPLVWVDIREAPGKSHTYRVEWAGNDATVNEWRVFSTIFTTPPELLYCMLFACNGTGSENPVWIDAVKIEAVK